MTSNTTIFQHHTNNALLQILLVLAILVGVIVWQWDVFYKIYIDNQVNAVGWVVNGSIALLFISGLAQLMLRFNEYRYQQNAVKRFLANIDNASDPLDGIRQQCMLAERYVMLGQLSKRRAHINHGALAATLHAAESSRNSYLRFVQSVLVLTGVFGTIVSLSISLLGASDILQLSSVQSSTDGMGAMIYGMSTALSTTMTAIIAYLIFGYFYIKLTDTQTYLISRVEEVTATTIMPHLQSLKDQVTMDYADSIRGATELLQRLDQSQTVYAQSADQLQHSIQQFATNFKPELADTNVETIQSILQQLLEISEIQRQSAANNEQSLRQVIQLLQEGFRL